jgi:hypothetical protein
MEDLQLVDPDVWDEGRKERWGPPLPSSTSPLGQGEAPNAELLTGAAPLLHVHLAASTMVLPESRPAGWKKRRRGGRWLATAAGVEAAPPSLENPAAPPCPASLPRSTSADGGRARGSARDWAGRRGG